MSAEDWQAVTGWGGWGFVAFLGTSAIGVVAVLYVQHGLFLKQLAHPSDRERIRAELTTDAPAGRRFRNSIESLSLHDTATQSDRDVDPVHSR